MLNIFRRHRSEREEALIDAVLKSPLIDQVIERAEQDNLTARAELLVQIAKLDIDLPAVRKRYSDAAILAAQKFSAAEAAYQEARTQLDLARMQSGGCELVWAGARAKLERALLETADPRLSAFASHLANLRDNACVLAVQFWVDTSIKRWGRESEPWFRSNNDEIAALKQQLSEMIAQCHSLRLQSVSAVDVSQAIGQMCIDLAPGLAGIQSNPPCLTAADCEVGPPMTWSGSSRWVVEELPAVIKPDHKKIPTVRMTPRRAQLDALARSNS